MGIPGVAVTAPGFDEQARAVGMDEGVPSVQVAVYPGPFALHSDAEIHTEYAGDGSPVHLSVNNGRLRGDEGVVHFPLPLRRWYDDLVFT